jgi:hypothetical protein
MDHKIIAEQSGLGAQKGRWNRGRSGHRDLAGVAGFAGVTYGAERGRHDCEVVKWNSPGIVVELLWDVMGCGEEGGLRGAGMVEEVIN